MSGSAGELEITCTLEGRVLRVDKWTAPGEAPQEGAALSDVLDRASDTKARRFLDRIADRGQAFDWELNLKGPERPESYHFAGQRVAERLSIVASSDRRRLLALLDGRDDGALIDAGRTRGQEAPGDAFDYDELTRVNNELASLHRAVAKQASELSRLNRRKNELLGMAAHDLRNPLAAIYAYSELLQRDLSSSLDSDQNEFLSTITATSRQLLDLVNDLVDFAAIESGELRLELERIDLAALVRDNLAVNRVLAERRDVDVRFRDPASSFETEVDARKLGQVMDNLLANAIRHSPAGGTIEVALERDANRFLVSVRDEGSGIAPDEAERLFTPFERGSSSPSEDSGAGLGLAICRRIVEGHGGEIRVESTPGEGATFTFSIPDAAGKPDDA